MAWRVTRLSTSHAVLRRRHVRTHHPTATTSHPTSSTLLDVMDKLVSLCKRRGFIFQSSEIYGGTGSVWDYGPLGVELKKNLKDRWWHAMVRARDDIEGLDAAILMHPRVWEASGHVARLHRPARRLPRLQGPLPRRQARGRAVPAEADASIPASTRLPAHRAAAVQPHVQDVHGAGRGERGRRLPAAGDGAGHLRELPERAAVDAPEGAVRHRADRQGVPQRDHAGELHLPHARVRADGDAVLRRAGHGHGVVRVLEGRSAWSGTRRSASRRSGCATTSTHERARALRARRVRHRVRLRRHARLPGDRGHSQPRRLRSDAATRSSRARSSSTSTSRTTSATCRS